MANLDFIGTGWGFPPEFDKTTGTTRMVTGKDNIQESIRIILTTGIGERIMRPRFGAGMERLLFEPMTTTLQTIMKDIVETAILLFEPRVILNDVRLDPVQEEGLVRIYVEYTIEGTNTRNNFVFPYYLEEGSQIQNETP